jgi:hypothetical protein
MLKSSDTATTRICPTITTTIGAYFLDMAPIGRVKFGRSWRDCGSLPQRIGSGTLARETGPFEPWRFAVKNTDAEVATVLALEEPSKALLKAITTALPAIRRLKKAKYPGSEDLLCQITSTIEGDLKAGEMIEPGSLYEVVAMLGVFSKAKGDQGAADYHYWVGRMGLGLAEAAEQVLECDGDPLLKRVVRLQQYAATAVAR